MSDSQSHEQIFLNANMVRALHLAAELNSVPFRNSEKWPNLSAQFERRLSAGVYHDGFATDFLRTFIMLTLALFQSPADDQLQSLQSLSRCHDCGTSWCYQDILDSGGLRGIYQRCSKCKNQEIIASSVIIDKLKSSLGRWAS